MASVTTPAATERGSVVFVYFVSIVAATSGLLFGFDIAVISGALVLLKEQFHLTDFTSEVAASALLVGCVAGASLAGWFSDRYGRRVVLMGSAVLFAVSSIAAALPRDLTDFVYARFAGGIAIGVASVLAPLYIAEVSPARTRGRLVSLNQMAIVTGILLAYLVNWRLSFLGADSWRWMFAVAAVPAFAFLIALFFVPESPRWLVEYGREHEALSVLSRVSGRAAAEVELADIRDTIAQEGGTLRELLQPGYRRALVVAVVLAIVQQWTGINTILFYGPTIFREHIGGHSATSSMAPNVIIGLVNFLMTIVSLWIIDKVGRRPLLMFSAGGMAVSHLVLGLAFMADPRPGMLIIITMLILAAFFAIGMGPGVWVIMSEIFPTRVRGRAMSVATISLWVACVVLTLTFLSLSRALGPTGAFWIYAGIALFTVVFVGVATPETKGRTLEEIERSWKYARGGSA